MTSLAECKAAMTQLEAEEKELRKSIRTIAWMKNTQNGSQEMRDDIAGQNVDDSKHTEDSDNGSNEGYEDAQSEYDVNEREEENTIFLQKGQSQGELH